MFKIYDGRQQFYQWDLDRKLIVDDAEITEVHFCNRTDDCSLVCETYTENGLTLVDVPNILLQEDWRINVYAFDKNYTKFCAKFDVVKRSKPESYVYTETETLNFNVLLERLDGIEEDIGEAVRDYLEENDIQVDLTGYATEEFVNEAIRVIELTPGPAGEQGIQGEPGKDGYTPIKGVDYFDGKDGEPGKDGEAGPAGADGKDYVLTEADKAEIAGMVEVSSPDVDLTEYYTKTEIDNLLANLPTGDIPSGEGVKF